MKDFKNDGINPATLALFEGTLGAVWGLALAVFVLFQATAFGFVVTDSFLQSLLFGLGTGALILVALPVLYCAIGWAMGYLHAWVFNAVARALGGIKLAAEGEADDLAGWDDERFDETEAPESAPSGRPATSFGERIPTPEERRGRRRRF